MTALEDILPILAQLSRARDRRWSLAALAREAEVSASHFQRSFSRLVHESPKQYTKRLQLEGAAILLLKTEQSVLDVALAVGFDSHEGFTRAFSSHFGRSPKDFRKMGLVKGLDRSARHTALIEHVGPCLRLFHVPLNPAVYPSFRSPMSYDITQQSLEEMTFMYKTTRCSHAKLAEALGQMLPAVFQHAMQNGIEFRGPPMTRYIEWGPGMVTLEAGLPVQAGAVGTDDIQVVVLPSTRAAVTVHTGPYDGLGDAHAAVEQYLHAEGLKSGDALREVYLTDPGEVPDPAEWKTQIVWPIAS